MSRYIDPTTDFGFKKLFGEETNKDLLMSFLEDVLELEKPLKNVTFLDKEQLPPSPVERRGVYDIFCENQDGSRFIVEMQKSRITFMKDRMIYYSTFPISDQAQRGKKITIVQGGKKIKIWSYELMPVYCIAVLGFSMNIDEVCIKRASLRRDDKPDEIFSDKLHYITIELPLFNENKPEYALDKHLNKWLYYLKELPSFEHIPALFKDDIVFKKAFKLAELANLSPVDRREYNRSLKKERDRCAELEAAQQEGEEIGIKKGEEIGIKKGEEIGIKKGEKIGIKKGKIKIAKMMLKENIEISLIAKMTGLTEKEIKELKE
ncbi:MAG: Rpn family recombination-promoting nuclease/putative transposase [Cyclobacteriaceae bacterium]|nr:Rpn family recombination-promoting nuclease/putative transposase [Cyclobacteriaceae bacterium]